MKRLFGFFAGLMLAVFVSAAQAEDWADTMPEVKKYTAFHKLSRGVTNIFTGPAEIRYSVQRRGIKSRIKPLGYLQGFVEGSGRAIRRSWDGFLEVASFPFGSKEPFMQPEFVWQRKEEIKRAKGLGGPKPSDYSELELAQVPSVAGEVFAPETKKGLFGKEKIVESKDAWSAAPAQLNRNSAADDWTSAPARR